MLIILRVKFTDCGTSKKLMFVGFMHKMSILTFYGIGLIV